jgi:hypothetical protein
MEEWKDIDGFEGLYQVSNIGRVRSLNHETNGKKYIGKVLSTKVTSGYPTVLLSNGAKKTLCRVHRLVARTFIENPTKLPEVNHLDGNKNNNCVENLEWCTSRENKIHAWVTGLTKAPPPEKPRMVEQYNNNVLIAVYKSIDIASILLDISSEDICKCCKGKRKSAGGYQWKYKEENTHGN